MPSFERIWIRFKAFSSKSNSRMEHVRETIYLDLLSHDVFSSFDDYYVVI